MAIIYGPRVSPTLDLNFARNKSLVDTMTGKNLIDFSRVQSGTSKSTYFGADGLLKYADSNEPRFDHDPTTGESLGLLIEEAKTNYIDNSTSITFSSSVPAGTGSPPVVTTQTETGPDGVSASITRCQFDRGAGNTANDYSLAGWNPTPGGNNANYSQSIWLKSNDANNYVIIMYDANGTKGNEFTVTPQWQRFTLDSTTSYRNSNDTANTSPNLFIGLRNDPTGQFFSGNTNSQTADILVWGPQIENGTFATSYIPTTGTALTRSADVASITGSNFSSWYNQSEGSFFLHERNSYGTYLNHRFELNQNSDPNGNAISFAVSWGDWTRISSRDSYVNGSIDVGLPATWTQGGSHKYAYGLQENNFILVSGVNSATDTLGTFPPNLDSLSFGADARATSLSTGGGKVSISRLTYYPERLPDTTLQKLTS